MLTARVTVTCPECGAKAELRYDPDTEGDAPGRALQQMVEECPKHLEQAWELGVWGGARADVQKG